MSGIYGDMLLAFPEQMRNITIYEMLPKVNGGWEKTENSDQTIKGIYQYTGGRQLKDNNGNLASGASLEFWTQTTGLIGKFTTINNSVYRLKADNDWTNEGGFIRYSLEKVIGNNGTESENTSWNIGSNNFS